MASAILTLIYLQLQFGEAVINVVIASRRRRKRSWRRLGERGVLVGRAF
jgi:hypothetical protein